MIKHMMMTIFWAICIGVVSMAACVGMLLIWATKFDKHLKKQTQEREEDWG
jgi:general stress protein CsbA